jgi:hypothetical protein
MPGGAAVALPTVFKWDCTDTAQAARGAGVSWPTRLG